MWGGGWQQGAVGARAGGFRSGLGFPEETMHEVISEE